MDEAGPTRCLATGRGRRHWALPMENPIHTTTLRDTTALIEAGLIPSADRDAIEAVARRYAIALTPTMRALIEAPGDPIARQFIPTADELITAPHEHPDPIGDDKFS